MRIYCDSSTKEACLVFVGIGGVPEYPMIIDYPDIVTNNVGEYRAVILALEVAGARRYEEVEILTDSQLVVNQVRLREDGGWKCHSPHLLPYIEQARQFILEVGAKLSWVPREENLAGKVLG